MKNYKKLLGCCLISTTFCFNVYSQQVEGFVHQQSEEAGYVWPDDRLVLDKLENGKIRNSVFSFIGASTLYPELLNHGLSVPKMWIGSHAKTECHTMNIKMVFRTKRSIKSSSLQSRTMGGCNAGCWNQIHDFHH